MKLKSKKSRILESRFFKRNTLLVAQSLLGKFLCRKIGKKVFRGMIIETEAYFGFDDLASHAARGKTLRNAPMFGEAGHWYIYFTYGMHWMLNIVTEKKDFPAAVLIRGVILENELLNGPAKLTRRLKIDKRFNACEATLKNGLWIQDMGQKIKKKDIESATRIGVSYSGPIWSKKHYRFFLNAEMLK